MTTGENLIIHPEPVSAPVTLDKLLDEPDENRTERAEEAELPPAYIGQKVSEPELPDAEADTSTPVQEGDDA